MDDGILSACDVCHSRKIRCDRRDPCANCRDANTTCRRDRQRQPRKVREQPLSNIGKAVNEIHARIAGLECTMNDILSKSKSDLPNQENRENLVSPTSAKPGKTLFEHTETRSPKSTRRPALSRGNSGGDFKSKKRNSMLAFGIDDQRSPSSKASNYGGTCDKSIDCAPLLTTAEARTVIQQHLQAEPSLSENKRAIFGDALASLSQSTEIASTSELSSDSDTSSSRCSSTSDAHALPSVELVDWMLRSFATKEKIYQPFDRHPFISYSTVTRMARDILNNGELADVSSIVCVSSFAAYFVEEILLRSKEESGLEDIMQQKLRSLLAIARGGISRMNMLGPATLGRVQALICGAINAQNAGELTTSWSLSTAASNTCLALGLNQEKNVFSLNGGEVAREALYCMSFCYNHDKGLAMNLGRPPCLQDAYMEVDVAALPLTHEVIPPIYQIFAKFAKIQSSILQSICTGKEASVLKPKGETITKLLFDLREAWPFIERFRSAFADAVGTEPTYQCFVAEYAYHSLHTLLLHWQSSSNTAYMADCLTSARAALNVIKQLGEAIRTGPETWSTSITSFLHSTVPYYSTTPFFVVFCNTLSFDNIEDHNLLGDCVSFLAGCKEESPLLSRLHQLCSTLLAYTISQPEGHYSGDNRTYQPVKTKFEPQAKIHEQMHIINNHPGQGVIDFGHVSTLTNSHSHEQQVQHNSMYYQADEAAWQMMDRQPLMQWLDSDFNHVESGWHCG